MSDNQDKSDKQFDPTPRRIEKAREEGNVFKSQDMTAIAMLMTGSAVLALGTPLAFRALQKLFAFVFTSATYDLRIGTATPLLRDVALRTFLILLPFLIVLAVASIAINVSQSGFNLTFKTLKPKPERISPLKGLKRMFGAQGLFNVAKSLLKIIIVGPVAYLTIRNAMPEILMLPALSLPDVLTTAGRLILTLLVRLIGILLFLSMLDFAFEKWRYKRDLKMSAKEVKDEQKESEGDPMMRVRRRQHAREMALRPRLDHAVMKADVVITNPTHYAIALLYDPDVSGAPKVLAKGIRKRALRIKELAHDLEIPTVEDRPLARALYDNVPEDQEIPEDLYPAVAAVLAEVYKKSGKYGYGG